MLNYDGVLPFMAPDDIQPLIELALDGRVQMDEYNACWLSLELFCLLEPDHSSNYNTGGDYKLLYKRQ